MYIYNIYIYIVHVYIIYYHVYICHVPILALAMPKSLSPTGQAEQVRRGVGGSLVATNGNTNIFPQHWVSSKI